MRHKNIDFSNYKRPLLDPPESPNCFHRRIPRWNMFDLNSGRYHAEKFGTFQPKSPVPENVLSSLLAAANSLCPSEGQCPSPPLALIDYADESGAFKHCALALTKLGHFLEERGQILKAHSFFRRALAIDGENSEAKKAYWAILPKVDALDNAQLEELAKKRGKLCEVERAGRIRWGNALLDIYYSQIYHACRMEKKFLDELKGGILSQEDVYNFLRNGGQELTEMVEKKANERKKLEAEKVEPIADQKLENVAEIEDEKFFAKVGKKAADIEHFAPVFQYILQNIEAEKEKEKCLYAEEEGEDDEEGNEEIMEEDTLEVYQMNFKEVENVAKGHAFMYSHKCSGGKFTFQFLTGANAELLKGISKAEHEIEQSGKVYEIEEDENPTMVRDALGDLCGWVDGEMEKAELDSVSLAAITYYYMIALHAFADANGRSTRLATNFILMSDGFPPVTSPSDSLSDKHRYFHLIQTAHMGDIRPFIRFTANLLDQTMDKLLLCANCPSQLDYHHLLTLSSSTPKDQLLDCPKAEFVGPLIALREQQHCAEQSTLDDAVFMPQPNISPVKAEKVAESPINKSGSSAEDGSGKKSSNANKTSSSASMTITSHSSNSSITYSFIDWAKLFMEALTPSPEPRVVD